VQCKGTGQEPFEEQEVGTSPAPVASALDVDPAYEPPSGGVRSGRLSIDASESGETHDEAAESPEAQIRLRVRIGRQRMSGSFSIDQSPSASIFGEGPGIPGCSTGNVTFTARR
jgi:hypothetical protein